MSRRACVVVAGAVIWVATLALASRLGAQQPGATPSRGKCVGVAAFVHPRDTGRVRVVRAWEDGSLEARSFAGEVATNEQWTPVQ